MADKQHSALTTVHRFAHVASSDPGAVGAYHGWIDTSTSSPFAFKIRNAANTAWDTVGIIGADGADGVDGVDGTNGVGVPTGGTTGQVLAKINGTDFNTEWSDPATGRAVKLVSSDPTTAPSGLGVGETEIRFNYITHKMFVWDGTTWAKSSATFDTDPSLPSISAMWAAYEVFRLTGKNDGDEINTLADTAGLRSPATQGTSGERPLYRAGVINSRAAMEMNISKKLALPDMSALTAGHGFFIVKADADPDGSCNNEMEHTGSDAAVSHYPYNDGAVYSAFGTSSRVTVGNPSTSMASWCCIEIISTSGEWTFKINGTTVYTGSSPGVGFTATPFLGSNAGVGYKGKIAAFYMFNAKISGADRTALASYINTIYGLSI